MTDFSFTNNWRSDGGKLHVQGHRGCMGYVPENTVASFEFALNNGATSLELDVVVSRDDVLVVTHNFVISSANTKDSNGQWLQPDTHKIREMDYADIKKLNVGQINPHSDYAKEYHRQTPMENASIPTLGHVFTLLQRPEFQHAWVAIEVKSDPLSPHLTAPLDQLLVLLSDEIDQYSMGERCTVHSFDWNVCLSMQNYNPKLATSYLTMNRLSPTSKDGNFYQDSPWLGQWGQYFSDMTAPQMIKDAGGCVWSPYYKDLTAENAKLARDLGLLIYPWTVNKEKDWQMLIDYKVDGVITDDCPDAIDYLQNNVQ